MLKFGLVSKYTQQISVITRSYTTRNRLQRGDFRARTDFAIVLVYNEENGGFGRTQSVIRESRVGSSSNPTVLYIMSKSDVPIPIDVALHSLVNSDFCKQRKKQSKLTDFFSTS